MSTDKDIYNENTIEFVAVAVEFCSIIEKIPEHDVSSFLDKIIKILPLLYLKALMLPKIEDPEEDTDARHIITEQTYEAIRQRVASLLGEDDTYLRAEHIDMKYSETPVACSISEDLADIYQDLGNFAGMFRDYNEAAMRQALYECRENFSAYWGSSLLNSLIPLHQICFRPETDDEPTDEDEN
ncbi:MAG: DUF5063 domain-containing protein [Tannerella sp.]|jgi:hypothetical protein|nr:DUF5063 domain-containing protein [Tannerella sp.]